MAHLDEDPSRAQMILFVGFVLAVVFVSLAFLLNSVIFTENLATRSEAARTSNAVAVSDDVERGIVSVIGYTNEHNTSSYSDVEGELTDGTGNVERLLGRQQLSNDAVVEVTFGSYSRATWINQSYEEANFTDAAGGHTWTLVSEQEGIRKFRIHITNTSKLGTTGISTSNNFTVVASGGGGSPQWQMEVYRDVGESEYIVETVDGDGNTRDCSVPDGNDEFWINISAGTVAGEECTGLQFGEDVPDVESIEYKRGDNAYGTYRLLVHNETSTDIPSNYNTTGSPPPPPITTPAAWNATVEVEYQTRTLTFETEVHANPGEEDE